MTDTTGYRANIGIIVPSSNTTVQPECEALRPYGVTNHTGRVTVKSASIAGPQAYLEHVERMRSGILGAVDQIMTAPLDHLILGVAIETFWGGYEDAERFRERLAAHAGVGVTFGSQALVRGLNAYGCKRIALLTPHPPQGDEIVKTYFEQAGFDVARLLSLKCDKPVDIARVAQATLMDAIRTLDGADVDAIVQVGTALPMLRVAAAAEFVLGKPVLSINAYSYWNALRDLGCDDKLENVGRVLMDC
jgi:maleate isomerase